MKNFRILLFSICVPFVSFAQVAPTGEIPADTVVAKVDGKSLTAGDVRTALLNMPPEFRQLYQQNPQVAIQQMYVMSYLASEAEKAKLGEESPLKEQLALLRANVLASAMLSHEHNYFPVSEETIEQYYERNKAKYQQSRIKVIYIAFKPSVPGPGASLEAIARATSEAAAGRTQRSEADARKLAEDLVKQIRAGADFGKLVTEYSEDPTSKAAGGDFGVVNVNSSYPDEIKKAVMALQPGEVTDPIRQTSAFYVIRVEDRTAQSVIAVTEPIRQEIRQAHVNEWFAGIRDRFAVTVENVQFFSQPKPVLPGANPGSPLPGATQPGATPAAPANPK
jgi:parvulin-like peptidyl-prolyl isomerase